MNQPTREEFERLEEGQKRLEEEVRKLREQITEPIKITRLEIDSGSMQDSIEKVNKRLDAAQEDTNILKVEMQGTRADILQIRESQADLKDRLIEHSEDLKAIKGKQDVHSEVLDKLVDFAESHDVLLKDMKDMKTTQAEQGDLLKLILTELRKSRGE